MKITCNRTALHEGAQLASSIVPARTPKPILQCAKILADKKEQKVIVLATDGEVTIEYTITQVKVEDGGSMVLPADRLAAILHEGTDETVDLELKDSICEVVGKDSRFRIYGHDPDDYPVLEFKSMEDMLTIQGGVLGRMIHRSVFSAAQENTRYAINGVLWEQKGKKLCMVATDGRRLAKIEGLIAKAEADQQRTAIMPVKTMQLVAKVLHDPEEKVQIGFLENQMIVCTTAVKVMSNLVQGRFPRYEDVIPNDCDKKVRIETELLRSGVRQVALLMNEQSKGVLLAFSKDKLHLSSSTPEAGDADIDIPVKYEDEDFNIGFNPHYILDALRVIEDPEVTFEMAEAGKPGMIRTGKDFLYVLMPVSV